MDDLVWYCGGRLLKSGGLFDSVGGWVWWKVAEVRRRYVMFVFIRYLKVTERVKLIFHHSPDKHVSKETVETYKLPIHA